MDRKTYQHQYYQEHKEKYHENSKRWKSRNPEKAAEIQRKSYAKHKDKRRALAKDWTERNFEKRLLCQARCTAKAKHLDFNIDLSDIVIPDKCPYLGIELSRQILIGRVPNRASIDRIDSNKGYIKGNVQIISYLANKMKSNATEAELITFAKNILEKHKHAVPDRGYSK